MYPARQPSDRSRKTHGECSRGLRRLQFECLEDRRLLAVGFDIVGEFDGLEGQAKVLNNPTSLDFGPDERLYVAEQNGAVNAFTVVEQGGEYLATAHEELMLGGGEAVVQSIQNHDDLGMPVGETNRQVTGLVATGTAVHPVLYVSSSDPRIATNGDINLDTNSGVITRVSWTGTEWDAVDIIRGLPRSEENHSVNGLELSADGTKLYAQVGGNTNNGAPSLFFSYTGEYALSGALLEIDLVQIDLLPEQVDPLGGQNGLSRKYVYDLPTLDDPTVVNDGVRETADGMDVGGPWGGNDGFNMAVLPNDAPLRIYADGFRNQYDIVLSEAGRFYTIDNGSNSNLGNAPVVDEFGEPTQLPNSGGTGNPEPLFLIEDGGYYGHPNPTRANQDLAWTIYDDAGNPDAAASPNAVVDLSSLVPAALSGTLPAGFVVAPTKFTGDAARLAESGVRIPYDDPASDTLVNLGTSSNGLTEYTGDAFDGALAGTLVTTQFNGNVTLLNLNDTGDAIEPLIGPGVDEMLGTADDELIDADGIYPIATGQSLPLDVTMGPDGTLWFAEFGADNIKVLAPTDLVLPDDPDFDNDGLLNAVDPFIRDASNAGQLVLPGQTYLWDFDANQDDNLPGPNGYGGGLTGVMIDGSTDFEQFFQQPSSRPDQIINLDNVKFTTAAGGGTTVIEFASNGDATGAANSGEFLFHTGVTIAPSVESFNVRWSLFNPGDALTGDSQQIGGYLGTGEQSNLLKVVAIHDPTGEIQIVLEDDDVSTIAYLQADDLFDVGEADSKRIYIDLEIDVHAGTATPTIEYETATGVSQVVGSPISLTDTAVLDAIRGDYSVEGQTTGLAVGLYSSNVGQPDENAFQAIFDDIEISAVGSQPTTLYRVNAGGPELAATDDGPDWAEDTELNPSVHLDDIGDNRTTEYPSVVAGPTVPSHVPSEVFHTERDDKLGVPNLVWSFDAPVDGSYDVRFYLANGCGCTDQAGVRIFDIAVEGQVLPNLDDIDLVGQFGHEVGGVISNVVEVSDGEINIEFLHDKKKPLVNGIEIVLLPDLPPGAAELAVTVDVNVVQKSSFGPDSFQLSNVGDKRIARVELDVGEALYRDVVFDPFGLAGDTISKQLQINTTGDTGVVDPGTYDPYVGVGGIAGYHGLTLLFDESVDGGFEPGEALGFSVDLDSNSIAGADKSTLDAGTNPAWDAGGVSGAELIGATFVVTFEDGTTATGQLQGSGNQAGSRGLASQANSPVEATLTVNGLSAGEVGTYTTGGPQVIVDGPAGETARVVLTKGIVQPVSNLFSEPYASQLGAQLTTLAASSFPANNAAEFQTIDVLLTGVPQDISSLFDFTNVPVYELSVAEDQLPLGFVAGVIDPNDRGVPIGPVSMPIYVQFASDVNTPPIARGDEVATSAEAVLVGDLFADNGSGPDFDPDVGDAIMASAVNGNAVVGQSVTLPSGAIIVVGADGVFSYDPNGQFDDLAPGTSTDDQFAYTITDGEATSSAIVTVSVTGSGELEESRLLVVDDGADEVFTYDDNGTELTSSSLAEGNGVSRGMAASADGSKFWVVDNNKHVFVYDAENTLLHEWQFTGLSAPEGIAVSGSDLWIVSKQTDEVYLFSGGAALTGGTHPPTSSFTLDGLNDAPFGITTDGGHLWVVNDAANVWKVFKYDLAGQLLGSWDLDAGNRNPRGIAIDPENSNDLLVINSGSIDSIYRYANSRELTSGGLTATETIALAAANSSPNGIAGLAAPLTESADFDDDGDVDGTDFLIWQRGYGIAAGATPAVGDANHDQAVDEADLGVWNSQFATSSVSWSAVSTALATGASLLEGPVALSLSEDVEPEAAIDDYVVDVVWTRLEETAEPVELSSTAMPAGDDFQVDAADSEARHRELEWLTDELLEGFLA